MSTPTFYHPELSEGVDAVSLSSRESTHAHKSRRLRVGSAIQLINGLGLSGQGKIESSEGDQLTVRILTTKRHPAPARRCKIAAAIPKGDRQRVMVEMLTQLGVTDIIPLQCDHSVTVFKQSTHDKWQRYAIEACKQSQNPWLPQIRVGCSLESMIHQYTSPSRVLAYADASGDNHQGLLQLDKDLTICIGPEGGFSKNEIQLFARAEAHAVQLGKHILRTEAAAVVAATLFLTN